MATKAELMAAGVPHNVANRIGQDVLAHLTPGADLQGGTAVVATATILDTASAGSVTLPPASGRGDHVLFNNSGNTQKIYPAVGDTINAGAANAAFSLTSAKSIILVAAGTGWIGNMSA